jgi:hypothetical protein
MRLVFSHSNVQLHSSLVAEMILSEIILKMPVENLLINYLKIF